MVLNGVISDIHQKAKGRREDNWRSLSTSETGTGQQVAQLHDSFMMMTMISDMCLFSLIRRYYLSLIVSLGEWDGRGM
jgi:hypothetical protein